MFKQLKEKARVLVLAPVAALSAPAFAGEFTTAAQAGADKVTGMIPDAVLVFTAMIGVSALFWVGRRTTRIFG